MGDQARFKLFHVSGVETLVTLETIEDVSSAIGKMLATGEWFTLPPDDEEAEAWLQRHTSLEKMTVNAMIRANYTNKNGTDTNCLFLYPSWGKDEYGAGMTVFINSEADIKAFEDGTGIRQNLGIGYDDMPVMKAKQSPRRNEDAFHEYAVIWDEPIGVWRRKEPSENSQTGYVWRLESWGAELTSEDLANASPPEPQNDIDPTDAGLYAKEHGISMVDVLNHLGITSLARFEGNLDDWKQVVDEMAKLANEKPATSRKKSQKSRSKSSRRRRRSGAADEEEPQAPDTAVEPGAWFEDDDNAEVIHEFLDHWFAIDLDGYKDEVGDTSFIDKTATLEEGIERLKRDALDMGLSLIAGSVIYIKKPGKNYLQFNSLYPIRAYGHRKEMADALGEGFEFIEEISPEDGELELPVSVVVSYERKSNYIKATQYEPLDEPLPM